jgi:hypothetical protein
MSSPGRRKAAIALSAAAAAAAADDLTALLTKVDEFPRSSPRITTELAAFLGSRGSGFPGFEAGNLVDELSFTALSFRNRLTADGGIDRDQEIP